MSWTAPSDDGGADITGYVLQRAYKDADDMMTAFMTIAATDAATWWNALDCPMMNDAVPADSDSGSRLGLIRMLTLVHPTARCTTV